MNILDLKFQLDKIIQEHPEMVDFNVIFRNCKLGDIDGEKVLICENSPLIGYFCDQERNEFCLMESDSFNLLEEFNEDDEIKE